MEKYERKISSILQELQKEDDISSYEEPGYEQGDSDIDIDKIQRGQIFFCKNLTNCILAMMVSLVYGLSVSNLLDPLVYTSKSDTPQKSLQRYVHTLAHVMKWHMGSIWEHDSEARKSLNSVRRMHTYVGRKMNFGKTSPANIFMSQYDMSLVQCGFIGFLVLKPDKVGITCTEEELEDYMYFWKWIGIHLGISNHNNICYHGYRHALNVCQDIDDFVVYPALENPPPNFVKMAQAFTDGLNILTVIPLHSYKSLISFVTDASGKKRLYKLGVADTFRLFFFKFMVFLLRKCPPLKYFLNRNLSLFAKLKTD
ncbi:hypothetical protein FSP39_010610 [Pinctada imbricata]|uniref:ER-bound oxygenase mpaB/mpaB'/Rubber oxygenase catalytic domain-containing protein n=1 Tax=Pinctada imbricata TaxID=66713 RepID=A0AA88YB58_PINIB|nr:hypothetical protein FSP39_010610 [Pinctada imbricata]